MWCGKCTLGHSPCNHLPHLVHGNNCEFPGRPAFLSSPFHIHSNNTSRHTASLEAFQRHASTEPALRDLALLGGEDYELLFTVAPEKAADVAALSAELNLSTTAIGVIQAGSGALSLQDQTGAVRPILVRGYDHFCRS